jgi:peptidoglycan LD-endopeptidase CwlK
VREIKIAFISALIILTGKQSFAQSELYSPPAAQFPNRQPSNVIVNCLTTIDVQFYDANGVLQSGRIVTNKDLASDLQEIFALIREVRFPITSAIPVNDSRFNWSDEASMNADNTSGYNYREIASGGSLSYHALGRSIDINPRCNPYIRTTGGNVRTEPANATYNPNAPCALSRETPAGRRVIEAFLSRGWKWGGDWNNPKDYQHFEKVGPNRRRGPYCSGGSAPSGATTTNTTPAPATQ